MEKIDEFGHDRLLYFDTDSIIFIKRAGDKIKEVGDYLMEMTDEIKSMFGGHAVCEKFVSLGPKNYGLEVSVNNERKCIIKTKVIRNDGSTLNLINIKAMMEMVKQYINGEQTSKNVAQWKVLSHKYKHFVKSNTFLKLYRVVSEKRRLIGNDTLPFGYKD